MRGQFNGSSEGIGKIKTKTIPIQYISQNPHKTYYDTKVNQNHELVERYHNMKHTDAEQLGDILSSASPHKYQYMNEYKEETVYIDPITIDYQIDNLYRQLIDYCIDKDLKVFKEYVFNKTLCDKFRTFCINNTDFNM